MTKSKNHEQLIMMANDAESMISIIPPEGTTIPRIVYEVLIENPYKYTEKEYQYEVHVVRRNRPDLKIESYSIKRSALLKKFGWCIHKNKEGKVALIPAESQRCQELAESGIKITYAYRKKRTEKAQEDRNTLASTQQEKTYLDDSKLPHGKLDISSAKQGTIKTVLQQGKIRTGQVEFRNKSLLHYKRCVVSTTSIKNVLDAAHIQPVNGNNDSLDNSLILRKDLHKLFDDLLWTIDPKKSTVILSNELINDKDYGKYHGKKLNLIANKNYIEEHFDLYIKKNRTTNTE